MLPLIIAGASAGVWYWLGNEQKRQNIDPKSQSFRYSKRQINWRD